MALSVEHFKETIFADSTVYVATDRGALSSKDGVSGEGEDGEFLPTVEVFDTGFRTFEATGRLPTRWGELKAQREN